MGAEMDFSDIGDVLSSGSDFLDTAGDFLKLVRELKAQFHDGQVQNGQAGASRSGGQSAWGLQRGAPSLAPEVRQVAATNGAAWVPDTTAGFGGVDLTGIWCPPMNAFDRCAIRQSGAYLNVSAMMGGTMIFAGEGMVDPPTRARALPRRPAHPCARLRRSLRQRCAGRSARAATAQRHDQRGPRRAATVGLSDDEPAV